MTAYRASPAEQIDKLIGGSYNDRRSFIFFEGYQLRLQMHFPQVENVISTCNAAALNGCYSPVFFVAVIQKVLGYSLFFVRVKNEIYETNILLQRCQYVLHNCMDVLNAYDPGPKTILHFTICRSQIKNFDA